jgi:uncharacterized membrane protein YciS (DUF1049 family)
MEQYELLSTVFVVGVSIPITLFGVYWFAVDKSKRYVDKEIRKVKR